MKGYCPVCGKAVEIGTDGLIPVHAPDNRVNLCNGSHTRPLRKAKRKK